MRGLKHVRVQWDYDLDEATLTFSDPDGRAPLELNIQVVGTTSNETSTWLWGWGNEHLPAISTGALQAAREFGRKEGLHLLTTAMLPDDESLGWKLAAIAARLLNATGAYRCPSGKGFVYVVFLANRPEVDLQSIHCATHGKSTATYICKHLAAKPGQKWIGEQPTPEQPWPDAWCEACDKKWELEEGDPDRPPITVICHHCYESARTKARAGWLF